MKIHWKPISYCFPSACGLKNLAMWGSQDYKGPFTCKKCRTKFNAWKRAKAGGTK